MAFTSLFILFLLALCGLSGRGILSQEEDLELDRQLNILNKPPIKTFQNGVGDLIDCIDIHKQPAFDHPLLKNHRLQMRPYSIPKGLNSETVSMSDVKHTRTMSYAVDCPKGSVPIRRTRKEDLIRAKSFSESFATTIRPFTGLTPGKHVAIVRSIPNPKITYKGIETHVNVYNPVVQANQSSTAQIWIQNGARDIVNSLQAGWMVAPGLFGDNSSRIFIYWTANGSQGCFNLLCPGFIQTDHSYSLGEAMPSSKYGATVQLEVAFRIYQDQNTGNWWLHVPFRNESVGYWPKELLPLLAGGASQVTWGGAVMGHPNVPSPQMGSGHYPNKRDIRRGSYFRQMFVIGSDNRLVEPAGPHYQFETFVDRPQCYGLVNYGYQKKYRLGFSFLYGGPGGSCGI
ncbi:hypothetical protein ACHQM5_019332 [Ranunculus cassubicifolius]